MLLAHPRLLSPTLGVLKGCLLIILACSGARDVWAQTPAPSPNPAGSLPHPASSPLSTSFLTTTRLFNGTDASLLNGFKVEYDQFRASMSPMLNERLARSVEDWVLPASLELPPAAMLGYGFDVRRYPSTNKLPTFAFNKYPEPPGPNAGTFKLKALVAYLRNENEVMDYLNSQEGVGLGLDIGAFSLGLDFKSSHMRQSNVSSTRAYYLVTYTDDQTVEYPYAKSVNDLRQDARELLESDKRRAEFYALYGTHYISAVQGGGRLRVLFTIDATTRAELDAFSNDVGLSAGYGGLGIDVTDKVSKAAKKYSHSISITSSVEAAGTAAHGLPGTVTLEKSALEALSQDYITRVGKDRGGLPAYTFKLTSYARLVGKSDPLAEQNIVAAAFALSDLGDCATDIRLFRGSPDYYKTTIDDGVLEKITGYQIWVLGCLNDVLIKNDATSVEALNRAVTSWNLYAKKLDWPSFENNVQMMFDGYTKGGLLKPILRVNKHGSYKIESLLLYIQKQPATNGTGNAAPANPAEGAADAESSLGSTVQLTPLDAPAVDSADPDKVLFKYEAIKADAAPTNLANTQAYLEVRDSLQRIYQYPIATLADGGLRADLDAKPRAMILVR